jgi:hypothetical protein
MTGHQWNAYNMMLFFDPIAVSALGSGISGGASGTVNAGGVGIAS